MQSDCKQMLKNRIFLGHYQEKRHVSSISSYRDLIVVNNTERDLKKLLDSIKLRIRFYNPESWIGITDSKMVGTPAGHCLWTEIEELPFGQYWFQIKSIKFRNNEVLLKIKSVRAMESGDQNEDNRKTLIDENSDINQIADNFKDLLLKWKDSTRTYILHFLSTEINKENIINTIKFTSLLLLSLVTGTFHGIKFLGVFTIRFMAEFTKFIHVATPIFFGIIEFFNKIVGGFYILLAMVWKDSTGKSRGNDMQAIQQEGWRRRQQPQQIRYTDEYEDDDYQNGSRRY